MKFPVLFTVLLVSSGVVLYIISSKTEDEILKIPEMSSWKERVGLESRVSSTASRPGHKTENRSFLLKKLCKLYDGVQTFVMFIGYPRSSHSLVGALLDAHSEIIIPHEFDLVKKWNKYRSPKLKQKKMQRCVLFYDLLKLSMEQTKSGFRAINSTITKQYTYHVPGLWQGRYEKRIKVFGDKKGGGTALALIDSSNMKVLEEIRQVVRVPMKFIHVIRNPFDNIATMMLRNTKSRDRVRKEDVKINRPRALDRQIGRYMVMAAANQRVRERYGAAVIDIPGHDTVLRPKETLLRLCDHLGVTCSEDYIKKCSKILYGTPSVTRDKVVWTKEQKARVTEIIKKYTFLKGYSFAEYPQ